MVASRWLAKVDQVRVDSPQDGRAEVVYVLSVLQAAFLLLAGLGEVLMMGGAAAYLALPAAKALLLLVLAAKVVRGRRWAMIGLVAVQGVTLTGFWIQVAAGALPWVDFTVNLVGLITDVALPATLIYLCVGLFSRSLSGRPRPLDPTLIDEVVR